MLQRPDELNLTLLPSILILNDSSPTSLSQLSGVLVVQLVLGGHCDGSKSHLGVVPMGPGHPVVVQEVVDLGFIPSVVAGCEWDLKALFLVPDYV